MEKIINLKSTVSTTEVELTWEGKSNSYEVYKNGKLEMITTSKAIKFIELRPNTIYGFKVIAVYEDGKSKPVSINIRTQK